MSKRRKNKGKYRKTGKRNKSKTKNQNDFSDIEGGTEKRKSDSHNIGYGNERKGLSFEERYKANRRRNDTIFISIVIIITIIVAGGYYYYSTNLAPENNSSNDDFNDQNFKNNNGGGVEQNNGISWHTYYDGFQLADSLNKPIMIDFYFDDCYYCQVLDENTYTDTNVIERSKEFVCIKVDLYEVDEYNGQQLTNEYGVDAFPTIVFLDSGLNEIHRINGYVDAEAFINDMDFALKNS